MENFIRKLYKEKHYRYIITLLELFQYHANGLSQKHFRYVLMHDPQLGADTMAKLENFFKRTKRLELFECGGSRKGSIKTQKDLNHYLKYLYKNNIIKKINRKKPIKYMLTNEYDKSCNEIKIEDYISRWDNKHQMINLALPQWICPKCGLGNSDVLQNCERCKTPRGLIKNTRYEEWTIFGLSEDLKFNEGENKEIGTYLDNIQENLWKIVELKNKRTKDMDVKDEKVTSIDFFYHGTKINPFSCPFLSICRPLIHSFDFA